MSDGTGLLAFVSASALFSTLGTFACVMLPSDERPTEPAEEIDVEGDWESARTLAFSASANIAERGGHVTVETRRGLDRDVDPASVPLDCRRYTTMEVSIDGLVIDRTSAGGWSGEGKSRGCLYPTFELRCANPVNGGDGHCSAHDLFRDDGTVTIGVSIGGEARSFRAQDWLTKRTIEVPSGALVAGQVAAIRVGFPLTGIDRGERDAQTLAFVYDDDRLNHVWCAIEHNSHSWSANEFDETGGCRTGCCTEANIGEVRFTSWVGDHVDFAAPARLPAGAGELRWSEERSVALSSCPFGRCSVGVTRTASARSVVVGDASE
jgi:hypothetical protein